MIRNWYTNATPIIRRWYTNLILIITPMIHRWNPKICQWCNDETLIICQWCTDETLIICQWCTDETLIICQWCTNETLIIWANETPMIHQSNPNYNPNPNDTQLKTRTLNSAFWWHSKLFGTVVKKTEIKDNKWCILAVFETNWNCRDRFDTRTLSRALLRHILKWYLKLPWEETTHALTSLRWREVGCARNPGFLELQTQFCKQGR